MQLTIKEVLTEILTIADYPKDKEKFIKEFEALNLLEAILIVYKTLPSEQQEFIKAHGNDPYAIQNSIPEEAYRDALITVTRKAIQDLILSVTPMLNLHQKEELNNLIV